MRMCVCVCVCVCVSVAVQVARDSLVPVGAEGGVRASEPILRKSRAGIRSCSELGRTLPQVLRGCVRGHVWEPWSCQVP